MINGDFQPLLCIMSNVALKTTTRSLLMKQVFSKTWPCIEAHLHHLALRFTCTAALCPPLFCWCVHWSFWIYHLLIIGLSSCLVAVTWWYWQVFGISASSYDMMNEGGLQDLPVARLARPGCLVALWVTNNDRLKDFSLQTLFPAWALSDVARWHWIKVALYTVQGVCSLL